MYIKIVLLLKMFTPPDLLCCCDINSRAIQNLKDKSFRNETSARYQWKQLAQPKSTTIASLKQKWKWLLPNCHFYLVTKMVVTKLAITKLSPHCRYQSETSMWPGKSVGSLVGLSSFPTRAISFTSNAPITRKGRP